MIPSWSLPRGAALFALAVTLLGADVSSVPPHQPDDVYSFASVVSAKHVPADPGPAPAFIAADYASYAKTGAGGLAGQPFVRTSDGRSFSCLGDTVYLYPDTPYVLWMVSKYTQYVYTTDYDSDPAVLVGAPSILRRHASDSVVRHADCAEATNGQFEFRGLPAGDYVALVNVHSRITTSTLAINSQMGITPSGEGAPVYSNSVIHGAGIADGWIVVGGAYRVPADGRFHLARDATWFTAAHLSSGDRYDPHMRVLR